ncbi:MAG: translation elongation factor Ts [Antarcticimicrobium sp.]|uniref:translation elongation factor Ts n=1 Tax=Antarcticimicrobium sp. TaxID=2824147 RepID=UPI002629FF99|nr:translation elongation factor Ts [Antarcticimicrobium sp.]MDF1715161.1 translation elongation factor Ts [Antarcticimicrobium sp.]
MAITAAQVKELRDSTGAGMMDAKKALTETDGDMEAAVDWLRTKGLAKAAKKSGRTAAEGLVALRMDAGSGVAVEINSETDFVAKNEEFQTMVGGIADVALGVDNVEALAQATMNGKPVSEVIADKVGTIGENMTLRRMAKISGTKIVSYVHGAAAENMGKIGVLVAYEGDDDTFARQVAMHVAAADPRPQALNEAGLDPAILAKELEIQTAKALEENAAAAKPKPEQVIANNIIPGRMKKFVADISLLDQQFVIAADKITVADAAKAAGVTITGFVRMEVGEGIAVEKEDFAAEVAKAAQG